MKLNDQVRQSAAPLMVSLAKSRFQIEGSNLDKNLDKNFHKNECNSVRKHIYMNDLHSLSLPLALLMELYPRIYFRMTCIR
jgi:hypothetical protein